MAQASLSWLRQFTFRELSAKLTEGLSFRRQSRGIARPQVFVKQSLRLLLRKIHLPLHKGGFLYAKLFAKFQFICELLFLIINQLTCVG